MLMLPVFGSGKGSPPRMRGKEDETAKELADYGITPAYAGKSEGKRRR